MQRYLNLWVGKQAFIIFIYVIQCCKLLKTRIAGHFNHKKIHYIVNITVIDISSNFILYTSL